MPTMVQVLQTILPRNWETKAMRWDCYMCHTDHCNIKDFTLPQMKPDLHYSGQYRGYPFSQEFIIMDSWFSGISHVITGVSV